jgi:hypothetical protein
LALRVALLKAIQLAGRSDVIAEALAQLQSASHQDLEQAFVTYLHKALYTILIPSCGCVSPDHIQLAHCSLKGFNTISQPKKGGQSVCAGGATSLAEAGVLPTVIQAIGKWPSPTSQIYIWKNPVVLQAMLFGCSAHQQA